ncbi:Deoxyribodipyrimidine photo-lyase [Amphibalanus amphitrite]|uniref:Deoxyribodipyrimidine photo-lyase n=1 Tax=Amphibalanus amphitrite TaxID=1232801 RepID=A0A6A4W1C0_AMPAM|nr:Deoxyribodipyrimidine photo-lyase [Amphibalanus amphitrite]
MAEPASKKQKKDDNLSQSQSIHQQVEERRKEFGKPGWKFNKKRVKVLTAEEIPDKAKSVVYWMSRDQRVQDNWAFLFAQKLALKFKLPLHVCFCLVPKFLDATIRHYGFMMKGLQEVEKECSQLGISFHLLVGPASNTLVQFAKDHETGAVVTDFSPLRVPREWLDEVIKALPKDVSVCQVDAHNVVPCWVASEKQEYGARTIRRKIMDRLPEYLTEFPAVVRHPHPAQQAVKPVDWAAAEASLQVDRSVTEVQWARPGTAAALSQLSEFCSGRLRLFADKRNDPTVAALSNLSPWLHFV